MTSAHPAGEGLEPVLRDQGIEEGQQQREVLYRDPAQAWIYIGSGGSGWPSTRLLDLTDDQLGGRPLLVL